VSANRYRGPNPPRGWDPYAPGYPLQGGYPPPRAVPLDPSYSGQGGSLHEGGPGGGAGPGAAPGGHASPEHSVLERIARLLERQIHVRGRPGGSTKFTYDPKNQPASLQFQEVARLEGDSPQRCVIYSTYSQFGNLTGFFATIGQLIPPRVLLRIIVGGGASGGTSNCVQIVPAGVPVAVTGECIYVQVGIFQDEWGDIPLDPATWSTANGILEQLDITAQAFIAPGDPTITAQPTAWYPPNGAPPSTTWERSSLPVWQGPGRIKQVVGYASADNSQTDYLQFFDWPKGATIATLPAGAVPLFEIPLPAGDPFSLDLIPSTKVVSQGLFWALSSTSGSYTQSTDTCAVWVERYSDLQVLGNDQPYA
jgi:hypothetical protein